jgi:rhamnosyltransferase
MNKIAVIIVTYNPDIKQLEKTMHSIINQVHYCIIVDNGDSKIDLENLDNIFIINLGKNYGIAYAQNRGIELAKQQNADFVLLSDQDTTYPEDFIAKMINTYDRCSDKESIGAIVPRFYDKNKMNETRIAITKFKYIFPEKNKIYYISHAIASGTLIPIKNLDIIGNMREELFIDWVDFEWCCRVLKYGYKILSIPDISIEHIMGDNIKKIGNKKVALRSRVRYYYMIRNGFYIILHTGSLKFYEQILFFRDLFIRCIGICLIEKKAIPLLYKAIYDGIAGNMYEIKGAI